MTDPVDISKDKFQDPHPEVQGCNHSIPAYATSGTSQTVGMPRRADGKVYCNSCHSLDNFKEVFVIEYSYGAAGDDQMAGHTHKPIEKQIPALACKVCGNLQLKM